MPDEVKSARVTKISQTSVRIEWSKPDDNNSKIMSYTVYLAERGVAQFQKVGDAAETSFELTSLKPETVYYTYVTAVNEHGEGYKPK